MPAPRPNDIPAILSEASLQCLDREALVAIAETWGVTTKGRQKAGLIASIVLAQEHYANRAAANPIKDKVYATLGKGLDLQLHIKITKADGLELVNIRDYVPSLKLYGRGVLFDVTMLPDVIEQLQELERQVGIRRPVGVHAGQQKLPGLEGF